MQSQTQIAEEERKLRDEEGHRAVMIMAITVNYLLDAPDGDGYISKRIEVPSDEAACWYISYLAGVGISAWAEAERSR